MSSNDAGASPSALIDQVAALLGPLSDLLDDPLLADDALVGLVPQVERAGRLVDGLRVRAAHLVDARTRGLGTAGADPDISLAHRYGHRSANAFLKHLTRTSGRTIASRIHLGAAVAARPNAAPLADITGEGGPAEDGSPTDGVLPTGDAPATGRTSPQTLTARFPAVATALAAGELALDAAHTITRELSKVTDHAEPAHLQFAEATLVAQATGAPLPTQEPGSETHDMGDTELNHATPGEIPTDSVPLFPVHADNIRALTHSWTTVLDRDNTRPAEGDLDKRYLWLGQERNGLVPIKGNLTTEVAATIGQIFNATLSPRTKHATLPPQLHEPATTAQHVDAGGTQANDTAAAAAADEATAGSNVSRVRFTPIDPQENHPNTDTDTGTGDATGATFVDERTRQHKQHDALATALRMALQNAEFPHLGGAPTTLVVQITDTELARKNGHGWTHSPHGTPAPVPAAAARHAGCDGTILRVTQTRDGAITDLNHTGRVFTAHQRKAITLRDGGCLIPGCDTPPAWCEIHHVTPHARGGPTHTDNGVMLCWYHHRYLDTHGWEIRMHEGAPQIRPPGWIDPDRRWRRPSPPHRPPNLPTPATLTG